MDNEKKLPTEEVKVEAKEATENEVEQTEPSTPNYRYGDAEHDDSFMPISSLR